MNVPRWIAALAVPGLILLAACGGPRPGMESLGWVDRSFMDDPGARVFRTVYDTSQIDREFVDMMRKVYEGEDVLVFFGSWCSDSQRELPRFFKVADLIGIPDAKIRLYALDRSKKSPDGLTDLHGITRVPTFIFLREGREVGRITEAPQTTMEADMLTILAGARTRPAP